MRAEMDLRGLVHRFTRDCEEIFSILNVPENTPISGARELSTLMLSKPYMHSIQYTSYWPLVSSRLYVHSLEKKPFTETMHALSPNKMMLTFIDDNKSHLDSLIKHDRDYLFDMRFLESLLGIETPQHIWLRTSIFLWYPNMQLIEKTYENLSLGRYEYPLSLLKNAGLEAHCLSTTFSSSISHNINSTLDTLRGSLLVSEMDGHISKNISSLPRQGISSIIEAEKHVLNIHHKPLKTTFFLADWHIGILDVCQRPEVVIVVSDLFIERVRKNESWSLFCPEKLRKHNRQETKELSDLWGQNFSLAYIHNETLKLQEMKLSARQLFDMLKTPLLFVDSLNRKSNSQHLGPITTVSQTGFSLFTPQNDIVPHLQATIDLTCCVISQEFNFAFLQTLVRQLVRELNRIIDLSDNHPGIRGSRSVHRAIGIGARGFQDVVYMLDFPWQSLAITELNAKIAEYMYYAALDESMILASEKGPYSTFDGSPLSQGKFQFDMWDAESSSNHLDMNGTNHQSPRTKLSLGTHAWSQLRKKILLHGVRNSSLIMHTTFVSPQVSEHLANMLKKRGQWSEKIFESGGSKNLEEYFPSSKRLLELIVTQARFTCHAGCYRCKRDYDEVMLAWENRLKFITF